MRAYGPPKKPLTLTPDECEKLQQWARRAKAVQRLALRSRIVLLRVKGLPDQTVSREVRISEAEVGKWRERFRIGQLERLVDAPRPRASGEVADVQVKGLITRALDSAPPPAPSLFGPRPPVRISLLPLNPLD